MKCNEAATSAAMLRASPPALRFGRAAPFGRNGHGGKKMRGKNRNCGVLDSIFYLPFCCLSPEVLIVPGADERGQHTRNVFVKSGGVVAGFG